MKFIFDFDSHDDYYDSDIIGLSYKVRFVVHFDVHITSRRYVICISDSHHFLNSNNMSFSSILCRAT